MEPSGPNLLSLLPSWKISLQAARKSPATIDSYLRGLRLFIEWCEAEGVTPALDRKLLEVWVAKLLANGAEAATARCRQQAVRRFSAWLADDEGVTDPLLGIKPPKLDQKVVAGLSDEDIRQLLKACKGRSFLDRRDEAMLRLLAECGLRAGELLGLDVDHVNITRGLVTVVRGKGGKGRVVAVGPQTLASLDKYTRTRAMHRLSASRALWLTDAGAGGDRLGYHGLRLALLGRADAAGVQGFHVHRLRHSFAARWLSGGGSESGLMSAAGWSSREMINRYSQYAAAERSQAEARRLALGDL